MGRTGKLSVPGNGFWWDESCMHPARGRRCRISGSHLQSQGSMRAQGLPGCGQVTHAQLDSPKGNSNPS